MNFLVNLMILCTLYANLFPTVISATSKNKKGVMGKIVDTSSKLGIKFLGFPNRFEIAEHVCHAKKDIDGLYGEVACHYAYENHFKGTELFNDAQWTEKAICEKITYNGKEGLMAVCGYTGAKKPNARFLVTNALKNKPTSYYYFQTEEKKIKGTKSKVKFVTLQLIPSEKIESLEREVIKKMTQKTSDDRKATINDVKTVLKECEEWKKKWKSESSNQSNK